MRNTKNGDRRSVPIVAEVADLLREHGTLCKLGNDQVFTRDGAHEVRLFDKAWHAALKAAKVEDFRWHDLRHMAALYLAMRDRNFFPVLAV